MALRMAEGSLFAVLLRSPWWYSALIATLIVSVSLLLVGGKFLIFGLAAAFPFIAIACYAVFRQLQRPGSKRVQEVAALARKMPARDIAARIATAYEANRYDSERFSGNAADLELTRGSKKILLCAKRFKAANTGVEPLKQLVAAGEKAEATSYLYVTLGAVSDAARDFAHKHDIEFIRHEALAAYFDGKVKIA